KERAAEYLAIAFIGVAATGTTRNERTGEIGIRHIGIGRIVGAHDVVLEVLQEVDVECRITQQRFPTAVELLAVVAELESETIVPGRLAELEIVGISTLPLGLGRTVDEFVIEVENRR